MRKKLFGGFAVLMVAVVAAWNVNFNPQTKGMSDVALANVEALAQSEIIGDVLDCIYYCWFLPNFNCYVYYKNNTFEYLHTICPNHIPGFP